MITPTVHLNGTSADELMKQFRDAFDALHKATCLLQQAAPHGRDYYPQGQDTIYQAQKEHRARIDKLIDVKNELLLLAGAIQKQVDQRRR